MLAAVFRKQFSRDLKLAVKRGKSLKKISAVIDLLRTQQPLPPNLRDHALSGDLEGLRDCHIENDWVLFYFYTTTGELILTLSDTGTHSDLF